MTTKGKRIMFVAPGKAEVQEYDKPELQPGKALLETECTLISLGTERDCLMGEAGGTGWPKLLGYSAVAKVLEVAPEIKTVAPGDRVAVYHSSHSSYQLKEEQDLVKIADADLSAHAAVFSITAAMGLQGLRKTRPELGESVMVMGLGLLGMFAMQCAHLSGAFPLIALDFNPKRRALALQLGADYAFAPDEPGLEEKVRRLTRGGVNCVIEVTGSPEAVKGGLQLMAPQGRIALVGCSRTPTKEIDFYNTVHRPGISIIGAHNFVRPQHDNYPGYWTMHDDMDMLMRLMHAGRIQTAPLVTDIIKPEQAPEMYTRVANRDPELFGVIFNWR